MSAVVSVGEFVLQVSPERNFPGPSVPDIPVRKLSRGLVMWVSAAEKLSWELVLHASAAQGEAVSLPYAHNPANAKAARWRCMVSYPAPNITQ